MQLDTPATQVSQLVLTRPTHSVFDADGNRIAEYDQTSGALIREYVWFDGAAVAVIESGVVYYIRSDHIGRPVFAMNGAGVQVWSASYLPFGGVRTATGTPITLRFSPLAHLADAMPGNGRVVPILARGSSRGRVFLRRIHRNLVCEGTAIGAENF